MTPCLPVKKYLVSFKGKTFTEQAVCTFNTSHMRGSPYKGLFTRNIPQTDYLHLNEKEKKIAVLCANGMPAKEMAKIMNLSSSTVNFHIKETIKKTHSRNKTEAIAKILCFGLLFI